MQALAHTSRTDLMDFQRLVAQGTNEISQHWLEALRADESLRTTGRVEDPLLLDSVPLLLDEILCFVESDDSQIDLDKICRVATQSRGQAHKALDVRELVREYQVLR